MLLPKQLRTFPQSMQQPGQWAAHLIRGVDIPVACYTCTETLAQIYQRKKVLEEKTNRKRKKVNFQNAARAMRFTSDSCKYCKDMQRLCDALKNAPVCCTYCASFWKLRTFYSVQFVFFRAPWTPQHSLQIWSHILQLSCIADVSFAPHCCKHYRMAEPRAMNWCCIMPVLAAECCKYRAILRQILRSLEILTANDQHMVHRYFHTEVLS